jgi:hypothetical protein
LIVVPSGLVSQWSREIKEYSLTAFKICTYHGNNKARGRSHTHASILMDAGFGHPNYVSITLEKDSLLLRHDVGLSRGDLWSVGPPHVESPVKPHNKSYTDCGT